MLLEHILDLLHRQAAALLLLELLELEASIPLLARLVLLVTQHSGEELAGLEQQKQALALLVEEQLVLERVSLLEGVGGLLLALGHLGTRELLARIIFVGFVVHNALALISFLTCKQHIILGNGSHGKGRSGWLSARKESPDGQKEGRSQRGGGGQHKHTNASTNR